MLVGTTIETVESKPVLFHRCNFGRIEIECTRLHCRIMRHLAPQVEAVPGLDRLGSRLLIVPVSEFRVTVSPGVSLVDIKVA